MKKIAIVQSNYIPWKGYFDMINYVDEFVLYDDMQYTKRDWRNRNKIKTAQGLQWLSIPVEVKGKFDQKICETRISDKGWAREHLNSIHHAYSKAPFYDEFRGWVTGLYGQAGEEEYLSRVNYLFLNAINLVLGIKTPLTWSMDYAATGEKSERLLNICLKANADVYLSGPAAKDYLEVEKFEEKGISVEWMDYSGYSEYEQLHSPFEHSVSVLDLILNCGKEARGYLKMGSKV